MQVAAELSVLRQGHKKLKDDLAPGAENGELLPPPMVVGRQIGKIMDPFYSNPTQTMSVLEHHSRLEIIREQAKPALLAHKEARKMDHGVW